MKCLIEVVTKAGLTLIILYLQVLRKDCYK